MFCVVRYGDCKRKYLLQKHETDIADFFVLTVSNRLNIKSIKKLCSRIGGLCDFFVSNIPDINETDPKEYICHQLFLTAKEKIKSAKHKSAGIIDPTGELCDYLKVIIPHCREIRVYCQTPEKYCTANEESMQKFGTCAIVSESISILKSCSVIISKAAEFPIIELPLDACNITVDSIAFKKYDFCPTGINGLLFGAAVCYDKKQIIKPYKNQI